MRQPKSQLNQNSASHLKCVLANEVSARVESPFRPSLDDNELSVLREFWGLNLRSKLGIDHRNDT
jgi:hypothetical protein